MIFPRTDASSKHTTTLRIYLWWEHPYGWHHITAKATNIGNTTSVSSSIVSGNSFTFKHFAIA